LKYTKRKGKWVVLELLIPMADKALMSWKFSKTIALITVNEILTKRIFNLNTKLVDC
jgi:hypothetical protein